MTPQERNILAYMQQGNRISPLVALDKFGCLRLASRISNLRNREGVNISSMMVTRNGKRFKEYWVEGGTTR